MEYAADGRSAWPTISSGLEKTVMSRNTLVRGAVAFAMFVLTASPSLAKSGPVFTKLLDTSYVAPDGQLIFTLDRPAMAGTSVAFIGATSTPSTYLFTMSTDAQKPKIVADNNTPVPDGVGNFTGSLLGYFTIFEPPGCSSPAVGSKDVVFVGRDAAGNEGVYSVPIRGGKVRMLADYNTPIPGGPVEGYTNFNVSYSFCNVSVSGTTVVFDAGNAGVYQVSTAGKNLKRIADPNTPATVHTFNVDQYFQPVISGKKIAFVGATVFGPYAIFDSVPNQAHVVALAKRDKFDGLAYPVISGKDIDFSVHLVFPNQGIYRVESDSGKPTKIMDYNTKVPANTPGTSFNAIGSTSNGQNWSPAGSLNVMAASTTDGSANYAGLFSSCKANKLTKILTQGDTLDGVSDVFPGAGISNLIAQDDGSYLGAILVGGFRYAAIYTVNVPGC